jgi:uncharacterized membrane protein YjjP (DUF1212 family)
MVRTVQSDQQRTRIRGGQPQDGPAAERTVEPSSATRVIDLALRIGVQLLASGEGSEDVEVAMAGITEAYGLAQCETNVTFTVISLTYQPSLTETPIVLERVVRRRTVDYSSLSALYRLADDISQGSKTLEEAYHDLADIRRNKNPYPEAIILASTGAIAATAAILVGAGPIAAFVAFFSAIVGDLLARALGRYGLPPFYLLAVAAMPGTAAAIALDLLHPNLVKASAIIVGGVFAVLPGRALVAAIQDGLTGFYITASARLLEVLFLTVALVAGIGLMLRLGARLGASFIVDEALPPVRAEPVYALAAAGLGISFAVAVHTPPRILPFTAVGAMLSWSGSTYLTQGGMSPVLATTAAATTLGLIGYLIARRSRTSALPYIIPAAGPLLPGSAVYFAMLSITRGHSGAGFLSLEHAAALALGLGAGVNLGGEMARVLGRFWGRKELVWRFRLRRRGVGD